MQKKRVQLDAGNLCLQLKKSAQDTANDFNRDYPYLEHWVEYVEAQEITT